MDTENETHITTYITTEAMIAGLDQVRLAPRQQGTVELIVCRPRVNERKVLPHCQLDPEQGLVGDNWKQRGYRKNSGGLAHPDMQLNLMNARAIALIAGNRSRWPMAGDQFYVDLDLSYDHLPPGTRLKLGHAVIEVTAEPHLGCKKFAERFGKAAALFVNSDAGKALNLRGINARVVTAGRVNTGDAIVKQAD